MGPRGASFRGPLICILSKPYCLHTLLFPDTRHTLLFPEGQGSVAGFCICAIVFLLLKLGKSEIFFVIMSVANMKNKRLRGIYASRERRGGVFLGGSEDYSFVFIIQTVSIEGVQCKIPPEKKL